MAKYWIKLYHEILDDPKMCRLPDTLYRRVVELFLLAGKLDNGGNLPPTDDIAWHLRLDPEKLQPELDAIEYLTGIIAQTSAGWLVTNFAKRQDHETDAERKRYQRQRDRKDNLVVTKRDNSVTQNVTESVTTSVRELDIDIDIDIDKNRTELDIDSAQTTSTDPFDLLANAFIEKTGYPIPSSEEQINTIREWVRLKVTPEDISGAVAYFVSKGLVARTPTGINNSVLFSRSQRIQAGNKPRGKDKVTDRAKYEEDWGNSDESNEEEQPEPTEAELLWERVIRSIGMPNQVKARCRMAIPEIHDSVFRLVTNDDNDRAWLESRIRSSAQRELIGIGNYTLEIVTEGTEK